jgi:uncharacterized Zn-finger protein
LTLHICLTDQLDKEDARKFTTATPAKIEHAIDRLWCPATDNDVQHPSSDRIKGDIHKVERSLVSIIEADGAMVDGLGNRNGVRALRSTGEAPRRGGARVAGVSSKPHKSSTFRHSDSNELSETVLLTAQVKFEKHIGNVSADDKVVLNDIFAVRTLFSRNSTTKGAMREPLRTITGQANMNKYLDKDSDILKPVVQYLECRTVGDKYVCPYCTKEVKNNSQGIKKAYNRHLGNKSCIQAREAAAKVASSSSASGGGGGGVDDEDSDDVDSSDELDEDTSMLRENDSGDESDAADDDEDSRPSKRSRK